MRRDCVLNSLTEEQQAELFDWLSDQTYQAVKEKIAKPPPDGFGLKTHINTLFRFYQDRQTQARARDLANAIASEKNPAPTADVFLRAAREAHAHSAFVLAHSPHNTTAFRAIAGVLQHHEESILKRDYLEIARQQIALARERFALERNRFEMDVSELCRQRLQELTASGAIEAGDPTEALQKIRKAIFGDHCMLPLNPAEAHAAHSVKDKP